MILTYDGKPIERSRQLSILVAGTPPDKTVKLTIWRDGKGHDVTLNVAALDPNRPPPPRRSRKSQNRRRASMHSASRSPR